jgi:transcriptional/translational regulatory protein YebC/TACO1
MSGHSKWSTIKREKGAKDTARGAVFTKLGNAIAISARAGIDPETNFALRLAIDKAKAANMPSANIQRALDRIKDKNAAILQEVLYEGYGPGGVAILVETATEHTLMYVWHFPNTVVISPKKALLLFSLTIKV